MQRASKTLFFRNEKMRLSLFLISCRERLAGLCSRRIDVRCHFVA